MSPVNRAVAPGAMATAAVERSAASPQRGFTLLELMVALVIAGLLLAVAVPASYRFYESMQYRQSVCEVVTALASARYRALDSGRAQDVAIDPFANSIAFDGNVTELPEGFSIGVQSAGELGRERAGVIRFYPEGGSSGGGIDLERADGSGVRISVDWLMGRVTQESYAVR